VVDALTANGQLASVGGMAYVSDLSNQVTGGMARVANNAQYAAVILDKSRRRKMQAAAVALQASVEDARTSTDDCARQIQESLLAIEATSGNKAGWHIREIMTEAVAEIQRQSQNVGLVGFRTGTRLLDQMTGGIRRGELWTIGALPGKAKTALGVQILLANAADNVPVMPFSIEMSAIELAKRMLAATSKLSASQIRNPRTVPKDGWLELAVAAGRVADLPIYGDDRGTLKIDQLIASARLHIRRHGVQLVVVDYLQIINAPGKDPKERVAYASNALRQLAKSEQVAVVQLSQLARPRDINDRPTMIQLKESGDVEAHSHVVVLPYLPTAEDGTLVEGEQLLIVGKNRNGMVGALPVHFDTHRLQFFERQGAQ
jgi:replicative DNA helicase